MKSSLFPLVTYFLSSLVCASTAFNDVRTSYGYYSSYLPAPINKTGAQVVYSPVYNNQTSLEAAELFDLFHAPMIEKYVPEVSGGTYGGKENAYYLYTKELVAGDFGVKCSLRSRSPIGKQKFREIFEETSGLYCFFGYAQSIRPDLTLPIRHEFNDSESNNLIQSVLHNGGSIVIDGQNSYWHQYNPKTHPAIVIEINCTKNDCTFISQKKMI